MTKQFSRKKPINLDLITIRFPITAIVSILHRISGFVLFLLIPLLIGLLDWSLSNSESFARIKACFSSPIIKIILLGLVAALIYHLIAGLRHLMMDFGIGESKLGGIQGARMVIILSILFILLAGFWLW